MTELIWDGKYKLAQVANAENLAEIRATSHLFIEHRFSIDLAAALGKYVNNPIILR